MDGTISGRFATRREAELAVEHLVQDLGVDRAAVTIRPEGAENSAGVEAAGADVESGHPGVARQGEPKLAGRIEIRVAYGAAGRAQVAATLRNMGGEVGE